MCGGMLPLPHMSSWSLLDGLHTGATVPLLDVRDHVWYPFKTTGRISCSVLVFGILESKQDHKSF